jgi:hypothetical protein
MTRTSERDFFNSPTLPIYSAVRRSVIRQSAGMRFHLSGCSAVYRLAVNLPADRPTGGPAHSSVFRLPAASYYLPAADYALRVLLHQISIRAVA